MPILVQNATIPLGYCRWCGYRLAGLPEPRCPECGRPFDPSNPRTFRSHPAAGYRSWRRAALLILLAFVPILGGGGWLYLGWRAEQPVVQHVIAAGGTVRSASLALWLSCRWPFRRLGHWFDRVEWVNLENYYARADFGLIRELHKFHHLANLKLLEKYDYGVRKLAGDPAAHDIPEYRLEWEFSDRMVQDVATLPSLRELTVCGQMLFRAQSLLPLSNLKTLRLTWEGGDMGARVRDDDLAQIAKLISLEKLVVETGDRPGLTDDGLACLSPLSDLRVLRIGHSSISDAGLVHLRSHPHLTELSIELNALTGEGFRSLKGLRELRKVGLFGNEELTIGGIRTLTALPALEELDVSYTGLTDERLMLLAGSRTLRRLDVTETHCSPAGVRAFRRARPDVTVTDR